MNGKAGESTRFSAPGIGAKIRAFRSRLKSRRSLALPMRLSPVTASTNVLSATDRIVAEVNYGGQMVEATIRAIDANVAFNSVTASRSKVVRAEPIAAMYAQGHPVPRSTLDRFPDARPSAEIPRTSGTFSKAPDIDISSSAPSTHSCHNA